MRYEVVWPIHGGPIAATVEADVSEFGGVELREVRDGSGEVVRAEGRTIVERIALLDAVRRAAGLCSTCCGSRKVVRIVAERFGKQGEAVVTCEACEGTGRARS
jgi:hypothetical protein